MPAVGDAVLAYQWQDWTPTLNGLTVGSGTLVSRYRQLDDHVEWFFRFVFGSGSAVGTGPNFSPPVTPASHYVSGEAFPGGGSLLDAATARRVVHLQLSTTVIEIKYMNATPTDAQITATAPWTWTTDDTITCWGMYEAA